MNKMYDDQHDFSRMVLQKRGLDLDDLTDQQRIDLSREWILSIHTELSEVLGNLDWKKHSHRVEPTYERNVQEELIDVQKYLWNLTRLWGLSPEALEEAFWRKTFVVKERWRQEQIQLTEPTLVVDLDDVIYRHGHAFRSWMQEKHPDLTTLSKHGNPMVWERFRAEFRESGYKQSGEPVPFVLEALLAFKQAGWGIVIMTYRPKKLFQGLEYDTLLWLQTHAAQYDKVIWAAYEKYFYVSEAVQACTVFVDDEPETCQLMSSLGKQVFQVTGEVDRGYIELGSASVHRVENLMEVWERVR